jgi:hypothetical protein
VIRFRPPVRAVSGGYVVDLGADESTLVLRLVRELRTMLTDDDPPEETRHLLHRLFPVAHPDDDELEAEYQRLMRDELLASKLAAFDVVETTLEGRRGRLDEAGLVAFMQSINSIRLVLGTMLEVSDDPEVFEVPAGYSDSPEYALYGYLSFLLEHTVRALSPEG